MKCGACGRQSRRLHEFGLCGACHTHAERAIARWWDRIEMDLDTLERFDAFCARKESGQSGIGNAGQAS